MALPVGVANCGANVGQARHKTKRELLPGASGPKGLPRLRWAVKLVKTMRRLTLLLVGSLVPVGAGAGLVACSGGAETVEREPVTGGGGSNATSSSSTNVGIVTTGEIINMNTGTTTGGTDEPCQQLEVMFTPDVPTVFILVDRSSSMWDNMFWDPLRDGVLEVVQQLHQDVRFGFGTFTGAGATCPLDLETVPVIDKNNYDAIAAFYQQIGRPNQATETPTPVALQKAREILEMDNVTFPGPKFILLVTDGNPDYCDNGQVECRTDTTVRVLQDAYAAGIHTFVVGLPDPGVNQAWLTAFANAGAGQPVSAPQDTVSCMSVGLPPATAAELPGIAPNVWPQGTYGTAMGPLTPYNVDPAQKDQLVAEIAGLIAGVKSCTFDLTNAAGEEVISIAEGKEDQGQVFIKTAANPDPGEPQAYDPTGMNGWRVNRIEGAADQIELVGASCDLLRNPETKGIEFGFPCEIIIEVPK